MAIEIDHLGIAVRSLAEGLQFYQQTLGMEVIGSETVDIEMVNVAMLPAGAEPAGPRIELLEASAADSSIARFIAKRGPGLHHIALRVDDLAAALERVRAAGGKILNEPRHGAGGHLYSFIHPSSAAGVLVELIQK